MNHDEWGATMSRQLGHQAALLMVASLGVSGCSDGPLQPTDPAQPTESEETFELGAGASSGPVALTKGQSRFAKLEPKLSNPIKVTIEGDGGSFPGNLAFEKVGPFRSDPGFTKHGWGYVPIAIPTGSVYFFPFDRDVEVTIKTPMTITKQIGDDGMHGCRQGKRRRLHREEARPEDARLLRSEGSSV